MPRSILKRSSNRPPSPTHHVAVHFPPSPCLTDTFPTHSPNCYDRSPIVVAPNTCALPERGCPGRTYLPTDGAIALYPPPKLHKSFAAKKGKHVHPRVVVRTPEPESDTSASTSEGERTPTLSSRTPIPTVPSINTVPPLIPDLSSESEESDGFTSPPPERPLFCASAPPPMSISIPASIDDVLTPTALSFLPYSPLAKQDREREFFDSGEGESKNRRRKDKEREREKDKERSRRDRHRDWSRERERNRTSRDKHSRSDIEDAAAAQVGEEEEEQEEDEEAIRGGGYKSFESCRGLGENVVEDEGCLAGF